MDKGTSSPSEPLSHSKKTASDADRKAIIRKAAAEAFERYDEVFKKLSKN